MDPAALLKIIGIALLIGKAHVQGASIPTCETITSSIPLGQIVEGGLGPNPRIYCCPPHPVLGTPARCDVSAPTESICE